MQEYKVYDRNLMLIGKLSAPSLGAALAQAKREFDHLASVQRHMTPSEQRMREREQEAQFARMYAR